ncbi:MAG: alpha/beta hydrolase family protein [Candidatus Heimdallarchaeota archaeon]
MALVEIIVGFAGLSLITIIILRYFEIIPHLLFWIFAREQEFPFVHPDECNIQAELVEIPSNGSPPRHALFFPSNESRASILMVPNWFYGSDYKRSLQTGSIIQSLGYNVLMPFYHHLDEEERKFKVLTLAPRACENVIQAALEYMITRPEIDKRQIGIYSSGFGTYLASQLIRDQPIRAVILEDGPVSVWNYIAGTLQFSRGIPFRLTKLILALVLWPVLWGTTWQKKEIVVNNLHACPTLVIAVREDQTFPNTEIWKNYNAMYLKCPNQLWWVHGVTSGSTQKIWPDEYIWQVKNFYDRYLRGVPRPDFHSDFKVSRRAAGRYPIRLKITAIPPQMDEIPLQILLVDRSLKITKEIRIFFSGASMTVSIEAFFRPRAISVKQFSFVNRIGKDTANPLRLWILKDAGDALKRSIKLLADLPANRSGLMLEAYLFLKGVLLNELGQRKEALKVYDQLHSGYWKLFLTQDSDGRAISQMEAADLITLTSDVLFDSH